MSCGYDEVSAAVVARQPPIVDVRTEDEFASGRIPGATNIPLSEVTSLSKLQYFSKCSLSLSRWSMPSVCLRRSFRPNMVWANHPKTPPSSRPAKLEVGLPRWETNLTRWDTTWWRPTQGLWQNGSRWGEKWKNKGCDFHYNCPISFDQKYPEDRKADSYDQIVDEDSRLTSIRLCYDLCREEVLC